MKTTTAIIASALLATSGFAGDPIRVTDERGDAKFERGDPLAAFDLVAVTFEALPDNQLKITFTGDGPISEKGTTYSWYAVWLDLDIDSTTGDTYSDIGCDLILAAESIRGTLEWGGEATGMSSVGREFPVEHVEFGAEGNETYAIYQSELFAKYPQFRAAAFAHHDGSFSDSMSGGKLDYLRVFEPTEQSVPAPDPFTFKKRLDPESGERRSHTFGITPRDRRIAIDLTAEKSNGNREWDAKIDWNIKGEDKSCFHVRFLQEERGGSFRSYIRTSAGSGSHKTVDLEAKIDLGQTVRLEFAWDGRKKKLLIDGVEVAEVPADFQPVSSSLFVYSADVVAENLEVE